MPGEVTGTADEHIGPATEGHTIHGPPLETKQDFSAETNSEFSDFNASPITLPLVSTAWCSSRSGATLPDDAPMHSTLGVQGLGVPV